MEMTTQKLLELVFNPASDERMIFLNDGPVCGAEIGGHREERLGLVKEWHAVAAEAAKLRGFEVEPVVYFRVDDWNPQRLEGEIDRDGKLSSLSDFLGGLGEKDILIVFSSRSITGELLRRVKSQNFRCASGPGVLPSHPGFTASYDKIPFRAEALNLRLDIAETAEILFEGRNLPGFPKEGYSLTLDLRGQSFHVLENGECRMPGRLINLPSGCANIVPYDGSDDDDRGPSQTRGIMPIDYDGTLVTLTLDRGRITDFQGEGDGLDLWKEKLGSDLESRITKLGMGINDACYVVGVRVVDEKTIGLHVGFGPSRDFPTVYTCHSPITPTVTLRYAGGREEIIMQRGIYSADKLGDAFT